MTLQSHYNYKGSIMSEDKKEDEKMNLNEVMPDTKKEYPRPEEVKEETNESKQLNSQ